MGWNWHNYEHEWQRRRKSATEKRIWRDVTLTKDENETFHFAYQPRVYVRRPDNSWKTDRAEPTKLATLTADNVLTLLYESRPNMTVCNRLADIIGRQVWSDKTHHRNKESSVRIRSATYDAKTRTYRTDPWNPPGALPSNWVASTIPYKAGLMFKLSSTTGDPIELFTPVEDASMLVKKEAIQVVKADTKVLRVLIRSMARLGVFEEAVRNRLTSYRSYAPFKATLRTIDYKNPTAESAHAVVAIGLTRVNTPNLSHYVNGTWSRRSTEEVVQELTDRAIDSGLKALRSHIYDTTNGYERVTR